MNLPIKKLNTTLGKREIDFRNEQKRRSLISRGANYWPNDNYPEAEMFVRGIALLEIVLEESKQSRQAYKKILKKWKLPGNQELLNLTIKHCYTDFNTRNYRYKTMEAFCKKLPIPELPASFCKAVDQQENDKDFQRLIESVCHLVLVSFNSKKDLKEKCPKIEPEEAIGLIAVVAFRSMIDHCEIEPEYFTRYQEAKIGDKNYDFNKVMNKPTTMEERRLKRSIVKIYKREGFTMCHDTTMLNGAMQWYKCRVDPGDIEAYLDELSDLEPVPIIKERARVENDLALYDAVTGYPRQWQDP